MLAWLFKSKWPVAPETLEEKIVYYGIAGTWALYFGGAIFTAAPIIGYVLAFIAIGRMIGYYDVAPNRYKTVPAGVIVWFLAMLVMAVTLIAGLGDYGFGAAEMIKSFIGWMKGWLLMAIFLFVGAALRIRSAVIVRASNVLALQTLLLTPLFLASGFAKGPSVLYISPLALMGGPGPEFFSVELYRIEPMTGGPRWSFFAPWAPAAGLAAAMGFIFAITDRCAKWKAIGILAALVVCGMSAARMAMVAIPIIPVLVFMLSRVTKPFPYVISAGGITLALPLYDVIVRAIEDVTNAFLNARADSTRVRATLQRIAQHRWGEAPIWGHGTVERGPHLVEYMPIGTHHTWNGLLFIKGTVGWVALAIPVAWTMIELVLKSQSSKTARLALGQFLIILLFSFGENLESLIYLYWQGMILVGTTFSQSFRNPFRSYLGRKV